MGLIVLFFFAGLAYGFALDSSRIIFDVNGGHRYLCFVTTTSGSAISIEFNRMSIGTFDWCNFVPGNFTLSTNRDLSGLEYLHILLSISPILESVLIVPVPMYGMPPSIQCNSCANQTQLYPRVDGPEEYKLTNIILFENVVICTTRKDTLNFTVNENGVGYFSNADKLGAYLRNPDAVAVLLDRSNLTSVLVVTSNATAAVQCNDFSVVVGAPLNTPASKCIILYSYPLLVDV